MKSKGWIALALCLMTNVVMAKQLNKAPVVTREWNFDGCHFTMRDPYGGRIDVGSYIANINPNASHPFDTEIQFDCQNPASPKTYVDRAGMRMTDKGWALDPSPDNVGLAEQHTTFYPLHGKGWEGGGVTQDDINGDENRRSRSFNFCIPHKQFALCGGDDTVMYLDRPKGSVLPQIIQLLESIEFIDPPSSASSATHTALLQPFTSSASAQ